MGRNRIGLQFNGWEEYMAKLDQLGGTQAMKIAVEDALTESKKYVNPLIETAMGKLPAGGKYSTGKTKDSIDKEMDVVWSGMSGEIKVGFDFSVSGVNSVFLMYGTPRMKPVTGLKGAIYGNKTKKEIAQIQERVLSNRIREIMEG